MYTHVLRIFWKFRCSRTTSKVTLTISKSLMYTLNKEFKSKFRKNPRRFHFHIQYKSKWLAALSYSELKLNLCKYRKHFYLKIWTSKCQLCHNFNEKSLKTGCHRPTKDSLNRLNKTLLGMYVQMNFWKKNMPPNSILITLVIS